MKNVLIGIATLLCLTVSGCYCFQAAHKSEAKCVVVNNIVDCTKSAVTGLAPSLLPMVSSFFAQNGMDWDALAAALEGLGLKDLGCLLAYFENQFTNKYTAGSAMLPAAAAAQKNALHMGFVAWKVKHGLGEVKFKILVNGKEVLQ